MSQTHAPFFMKKKRPRASRSRTKPRRLRRRQLRPRACGSYFHQYLLTRHDESHVHCPVKRSASARTARRLTRSRGEHLAKCRSACPGWPGLWAPPGEIAGPGVGDTPLPGPSQPTVTDSPPPPPHPLSLSDADTRGSPSGPVTRISAASTAPPAVSPTQSGTALGMACWAR